MDVKENKGLIMGLVLLVVAATFLIVGNKDEFQKRLDLFTQNIKDIWNKVFGKSAKDESE